MLFFSLFFFHRIPNNQSLLTDFLSRASPGHAVDVFARPNLTDTPHPFLRIQGQFLFLLLPNQIKNTPRSLLILPIEMLSKMKCFSE